MTEIKILSDDTNAEFGLQEWNTLWIKPVQKASKQCGQNSVAAIALCAPGCTKCRIAVCALVTDHG